MDYKAVSFYKYFKVKNPNKMMNGLKRISSDLNILGRILIAKEGTNAVVVFANKETNIEIVNSTVPILKAEQLLDFIKSNKSKTKIAKRDLSDLKTLFDNIKYTK